MGVPSGVESTAWPGVGLPDVAGLGLPVVAAVVGTATDVGAGVTATGVRHASETIIGNIMSQCTSRLERPNGFIFGVLIISASQRPK
jgi:hypothetical protein